MKYVVVFLVFLLSFAFAEGIWQSAFNYMPGDLVKLSATSTQVYEAVTTHRSSTNGVNAAPTATSTVWRVYTPQLRVAPVSPDVPSTDVTAQRFQTLHFTISMAVNALFFLAGLRLFDH